MNTVLYRQGDVLLVKTGDIKDKSVVASGRVVLADGEVTGHQHVVEGDVTEYLAMGRRLLECGSTTVVIHQEHAPITLPAGMYWIVAQREYSPQEIRRVAD